MQKKYYNYWGVYNHNCFLLLCIVFFTQSLNAQDKFQGKIYNNPVIAGFNPDPSVCRVGEDYYLVTSSFGYFPGIPVYHSKDLIHWQQIGNVLTRKSQLDLNNINVSYGIFASTIRYHNGIFYVISTLVGGKGNFYVTSTNPLGPWSDPIWVDANRFDPSLLFDNNGKVYYTRRAEEEIGGTVQAEIDIKSGKLLSPLKKICDGFVSQDQEGPHLYKMNGWYYLMCAEGGTRFMHMETIARSKSPWGPFEKCPYNPILANHTGWDEVRSTGHGDLVQDHKGNWWMVHLATRHPNYDAMSVLGRETFLLPVIWKNGWPIVNSKKISTIKISTNKSLPQQTNIIDNGFFKEEFNDDRLNNKFISIGNLDSSSFSIDKNILKLKGNGYNLDSANKNPVFIGIRQQSLNAEITTEVSFSPNSENEEAGLSCFMYYNYHYEIFISLRNNTKCIVVRRTVADLTKEDIAIPFTDEKVTLKIVSTPTHYILGYVNGKNKFQEVVKASAQSLATEVAGVWMGMIIGMYSSGNGNNCRNFAEFDLYQYLKK